MDRRRVFQIIWMVLAIVYILSVVFGVKGWMSGPRAGFSVEQSRQGLVASRVVTAGAAWAAGVRPGDELLEVNGEAATLDGWLDSGDRGDTFAFRSRTGNRIVVSTAEEGAAGTRSMFLLELTAAVFAAVSLFLVSRTTLTIQVASFAWLGMVAASAIAVAPGSIALEPVSLFIQATTLHWLPVAFVGFFYVFGREHAGTRRFWPEWMLVFPATALMLDVLAALERTALPDIRSLAVVLDILFLGGGIVFGIGLLIRRVVASKSRVFREQTRVIVAGTVLAVTPLLLLFVIPEAVGIGSFLEPQFAVLTTVFIPLAFGYAILRHELMGIRRFVHRGLSYSIISASVLLLYLGVLIALRGILPSNDGGSALNLSVIVAILVGVPLVPQVRAGASSLVDRLLYRDFVNHREVLREISIEAVHTTDLEGLSGGILKRLVDALGLTFATYLERDGEGTVRSLGTVGVAPDRLEQKVARGSNALQGPSALRIDLDTGQALCASIPGDTQQGLLFLGPQLNEEPFRPEDAQLAQTVGSLISTVVARIRLLEELRAKSVELAELNMRLVEIEEQQLARLSGYLHDEPLQKVTYVLGQYRERFNDDQLTKILLEVTNDLRLVSGTLSPAMLVDLGLVRTVESLVREVEGRNKFRINFQYSGIGREERIPPGVELAAYRVAQEALANCQKHSKATAVWIELAVSADTLVLSVDDNGVGLGNGVAPEDEQRASIHLGLRHLKQRVESYGGSLTLSNRRTRGTSVVATIPIAREFADAGTEFRIHAN